LVNPVTAFDLAVLLRPARSDVAMANTSRLYGQRERQWELGAVVTLQLADPKGEPSLHVTEEMQAGVLILPRVQAQDAQAGAVIQRGVLKDGVPP
jgi:hypothetical protein